MGPLGGRGLRVGRLCGAREEDQVTAVRVRRRARGARQSRPQPLTEAKAGEAFVKEALEKSL